MINRKNQTGFTLVELLVSMVLTLILAGATLGLQYILSQNRRVAISNFYGVETANSNLSSLVREIRNARLSESGSYPIVLATSDELIFYSDYDFDDVVERVRYTLNGVTLERGIIEPTGQPATYPTANESVKTMSTTVRNQGLPLFTYYNEDWPNDTTNNPLPSSPSLADIKLVNIYIQITTNENTPENDYLLDSLVQIRMLKENL